MFFYQTDTFWHDYGTDSEDDFHSDDDADAIYEDADAE